MLHSKSSIVLTPTINFPYNKSQYHYCLKVRLNGPLSSNGAVYNLHDHTGAEHFTTGECFTRGQLNILYGNCLGISSVTILPICVWSSPICRHQILNQYGAGILLPAAQSHADRVRFNTGVRVLCETLSTDLQHQVTPLKKRSQKANKETGIWYSKRLASGSLSTISPWQDTHGQLK